MKQIRKARQFVVVAVAAAVLTVAGVSLAVASSHGDVYTGCLTSGGAVIKVAIGTSPAGNCNGQQTQISWNETGQTGPQGPIGPQGPAGPQGAQGTPGAAGTAGSDGATGPTGPQGPVGSSAVTGWEIVTDTDRAAGLDIMVSEGVACPAGKVVVGGGAAIESAATLTAFDKQAISKSRPFENSDGTSGWSAEAREVGIGTLDWWDLTVYAICVDAS